MPESNEAGDGGALPDADEFPQPQMVGAFDYFPPAMPTVIPVNLGTCFADATLDGSAPPRPWADVVAAADASELP